MNQNIIGILAGMGPRSTSPFLEFVLDQCQIQYGAKNDIDYPPMMIYSLPTPFYLDRPINHEMMKKTIIEGLQYLESISVKFIAMPCNTAHIYFDDLQKSINIPILNIVEKTIKKINHRKRKITIFATESTFISGIYQAGIMKSENHFIFKDVWQGRVDKLLKLIKDSATRSEVIFHWDELINQVIKADVEKVIIACTDLSVLKGNFQNKIEIIDSSKTLAESVVKKYLKLI